MKKELINRVRVSGRVYDHSLEIKTVKNTASQNFGKEFIGGKLDIATDDEGLNIVTVEYTYVTPVTSKNTKNKTYTVLKSIIENGKTITKDGFENATMVECSSSIDCNPFYIDRGGKEELIQSKRISNGFVTIVNKLKEEKLRNQFECDMLIKSVEVVEADGERIKENYAKLSGATFDFRGALVPIDSLIVKGEGGIQYFMSLDASSNNLVFTKLWGDITSKTEVTTKVEESAFGEPVIKEYPKTIRQWVVTGSAKEFYPVGDPEQGITLEEITQKNQDRMVYLADVKKRADEYKAQKAAANANTFGGVTAVPTSVAFNF